MLSPADVLFVSASFRDLKGPDYEPANRLLIDPVLQFQPWLEFNRAMLRRGRLPLWNDLAGCGAPHLANSQSAVFDPFHVIAYLGTLPDALAWMAAARLWVAGLGMFVLARSWGLGPWGRWFAGLTFPFCGFVVVWLLYPVTAAAVWMPWLFWATDRVLERPGRDGRASLGLVVGCLFLAGHVQTSAHVLLAAGVYAVWRSRAGVAARLAGVGARGRAGVDDRGGLDRAVRGLPGQEPGLGRPGPGAAVPLAVDAASAPGHGLHGGPLCVRESEAGAAEPGAGPRRAQPERVGRRFRGAGDAGLAGPARLAAQERQGRGPLPRGLDRLRVPGRVRVPAGRQPAPRGARP